MIAIDRAALRKHRAEVRGQCRILATQLRKALCAVHLIELQQLVEQATDALPAAHEGSIQRCHGPAVLGGGRSAEWQAPFSTRPTPCGSCVMQTREETTSSPYV